MQKGITYWFPNFNGATNEVPEWIRNFTPHFNGCNYVSILGFKLIHVSKEGPTFEWIVDIAKQNYFEYLLYTVSH